LKLGETEVEKSKWCVEDAKWKRSILLLLQLSVIFKFSAHRNVPEAWGSRAVGLYNELCPCLLAIRRTNKEKNKEQIKQQGLKTGRRRRRRRRRR